MRSSDYFSALDCHVVASCALPPGFSIVESETTGHPAAFNVCRMPFCWSVRICLFRVRAPVNSATWPYGPGVRKSGGFVIGIVSDELSALEAPRNRLSLASKIKEGGWPIGPVAQSEEWYGADRPLAEGQRRDDTKTNLANNSNMNYLSASADAL